jgi:hypothetical protein
MPFTMTLANADRRNTGTVQVDSDLIYRMLLFLTSGVAAEFQAFEYLPFYPFTHHATKAFCIFAIKR